MQEHHTPLIGQKLVQKGSIKINYCALRLNEKYHLIEYYFKTFIYWINLVNFFMHVDIKVNCCLNL